MRILWDVVIFVCILYASAESPLRIVLSYEQGFAINGLYVLVDLLYFGDILTYIFSPEFVKGREVYIQKRMFFVI